MTKDRARKRATRNRVALTGERYVVARHATPEVRSNPAPRHHGRANRRHGEPHVLVAWQGWIARRVGAGRE
jgi:hypothetical protein